MTLKKFSLKIYPIMLEDYINEKNELQEIILLFFDSDLDNFSIDFQNLTDFLDKNQYLKNHEKLKLFLKIISQIAKNHKCQNFTNKIEKLFNYLKGSIKKSFSNIEIFDIFQKNLLILECLFREKIISFNEEISKSIIQDENHENFHFFYPEIKSFLDEDKIKQKLLVSGPDYFEDFEKKRQIGQNETYICSLIREDLIDEFVAHINRTNCPFDSTIKKSFLETNSYLQKEEKTSLIEYSAFFGSIQIFNYLRLNNAELTPSLWMYAIHGNNPEIIHLLEENKVKPSDETFEQCLKESIKCHHNDIANYIIDKNIDRIKYQLEFNFRPNVLFYGFHYNNYAFIKPYMNHRYFFFYACQFNYLDIVKYFVNDKNVDINKPLILMMIFLMLFLFIVV